MGYRSDLESRLAKKTTRAIVDYQLIDDGDRIMVGLSGGKDSWALLQILDVLRQRAPVRFSLIARGCGAASCTASPRKSAPRRSRLAITPTISSRRCS